MKKILLFIGCFLAVAFLAPVSAWASQTTRTLQPGRTYEFVGTDARVISHINIAGTGRYEFVETNALGELQRFGFSNWRISVSGTGRTAVTPVAPMQVTFDSSRIRVYESAGSVLRQVNLADGQTLSLENTAMLGRHVRVTQATGNTYDFVITNRFGEVDNFGFQSRFPQMNIIGGGTKTITARGGSLTVYFPSIWYGNDIRVSRPLAPALTMHRLTAGQELTLANFSGEAVTLNAHAAHTGVTFQYRFVMRGRDGHVVDYGNVTSNQIRIPINHTLHLTPAIDGELVFPHILRDSISIDHGVAAPMYYTLRPGNSLVIANDDTVRAHSIFLRCGTDSGDFSFDYVLDNDGEITFGILENVTAARHVFNLPAGASVTITATEGQLTVNTPDISAITANAVQGASLSRHLILPGRSAYITNDSGYAVDIMAVADESTFGFDFVRYDMATGAIEDFGRMNLRSNLTIYDGQSVLLTSHDYSITLIVPLALTANGLTIAESSRTALFRQALAHGEALRIDNIDRRYHHSFLVEDDAMGRTWSTGFAYDFVMESNRDGIQGYGMNDLGQHVVPTSHRVTLMPRPGRELSVAFPAEWYGRYFRTRPVADEPLHHITLAPGRQIVIHNNTRDTFTLSNNSPGTLAGFHIRTDGQPAININTAMPRSGDIVVPPSVSVFITAALGADLEIWMPMSLARQLRLV